MRAYHVLDLSSIGVHAPGRLPRLDVTPHHGRHITLVVHEARVEVGRLVWVGTLDVGAAAGERVLEEVKHGEELARRQQHVITEPAGNNAVVHHGLVGLILKVGVPAALEVRSRPVLELLELFLSRADLDAGFDAIGG